MATMRVAYTIRRLIIAVISSVLIFQNSFVDSFPLPDAPFESSNVTPLLSTDAAQKREDDGVVLLVKDPLAAINQQQPPPDQAAAAQTFENPSITQIRIPAVDTVLENEIWQYRYPPFDNLFAQKDKDDANETSLSGRSSRLSTDALPSYVIGILDPAELVDGLFQQRPFGLNRNQPNFKRNSVSISADDQLDREGKSVISDQTKKIFGVPRIVLDSDDDRWVWRN